MLESSKIRSKAMINCHLLIPYIIVLIKSNFKSIKILQMFDGLIQKEEEKTSFLNFNQH